MARYAGVVGGLVLGLLALFAVVEALELPYLVAPGAVLAAGGIAAAAFGVLLLTVDIALPVPSSVVMTLHGAVFGVAAGAVLSLLGTTCAAAAGLAIGRRGGPLLDRLVSPEESARATRLLNRWGFLAIVLSRPVPLLAETVILLAGAARVPRARALGAALLGNSPGALLYAVAGAYASGQDGGVLVFLCVVLLSALAWAASQGHLRPRALAAAAPRRSGAVLVAALVVTTAAIHASRAWADPEIAPLFAANAAGYLALLGGLYLVAHPPGRRRLVRRGLIAYAALTVVLWGVWVAASGEWTALGAVDKLVELTLIGLLAREERAEVRARAAEPGGALPSTVAAAPSAER